MKLRDRLSACDLGSLLKDDMPRLASFPPDQQPWSDRPKDRTVTIIAIPQKGDIANDGPTFFLFHPAGSKAFWLGKSKGLSGGTDWYGPAALSNDGTLLVTVGAGTMCR